MTCLFRDDSFDASLSQRQARAASRRAGSTRGAPEAPEDGGFDPSG